MDRVQRILSVLAQVDEDVDFASETALIDDGIIDSFDITKIIAALDEAYGIHIRVADIEPENFNSVQAMLEVVERYGATP